MEQDRSRHEHRIDEGQDRHSEQVETHANRRLHGRSGRDSQDGQRDLH